MAYLARLRFGYSRVNLVQTRSVICLTGATTNKGRAWDFVKEPFHSAIIRSFMGVDTLIINLLKSI